LPGALSAAEFEEQSFWQPAWASRPGTASSFWCVSRPGKTQKFCQYFDI